MIGSPLKARGDDIKGYSEVSMLEKDVISEFLFNFYFYTDTETINEEPTLRHTAKNTGSGLQPLDDFKSSSVYNNNISRSSDKSKISFQRINNKTKEFYSPLEKIIRETKQEKYTSKDFLNWLKNQKGYKPAEFEWIGLEDFLSDKRSVTKQELLVLYQI